jgi:hypothetical protein
MSDEIELADIVAQQRQREEIIYKKGEIIATCPVSSNVDELLERFQIDREYWDITKQVVNEWGSVDNYNRQCKAWLSAKGDILDWPTFKAQFIEDIKSISPKVKFKHTRTRGRACLEIDIFDLHLGKLGWKEETGENYDKNIAKQRFLAALNALCDYARPFDIERIVFPVGNDFFNSDSDYPYPQTTAGTPQENDSRWQKLFREGRQLVCQGVDFLADIAPVYIPIIPGNHDRQKSFYLGDVLEARYENNKNVTIDNSAAPRKYFQYHNSMIGFTHGRASSEGEQRLLLLMPQEQPQMFAQTKYREWHCGDIHHKRKIKIRDEEDFSGIVLRYMRTMKGTDEWENERGYRGVKGAEAYVWDREHGPVANFSYNI